MHTTSEEFEEALKFYRNKEGPKHRETKDNVCTWFSMGMYLPRGGSHRQDVTSFNALVWFYMPEATIDVLSLGRRQMITESKKAFSVPGVAVSASSSFLTTQPVTEV